MMGFFAAFSAKLRMTSLYGMLAYEKRIVRAGWLAPLGLPLDEEALAGFEAAGLELCVAGSLATGAEAGPDAGWAVACDTTAHTNTRAIIQFWIDMVAASASVRFFISELPCLSASQPDE